MTRNFTGHESPVTSHSALWLLAVVAFVCGVALVAAARWLRPLTEAERAMRAGNFDLALAQYAAGEARFDRLPVAKPLLARAYHASISNQLWLHYRSRRYDAVIDKAAASPATAAARFWTGCALFGKGKDEEEPQARIGWLSRAEEEFRAALQLEPDDWDAKFNYELTRRLLSELRKQPKTPPSQLLQLLRPQPKAGPPARRVG